MNRLSRLLVMAAMAGLPPRIQETEGVHILTLKDKLDPKDYDMGVLETIARDGRQDFCSNEYKYPHSAAQVSESHPATASPHYIQSLKQKAQAKRDRRAAKKGNG